MMMVMMMHKVAALHARPASKLRNFTKFFATLEAQARAAGLLVISFLSLILNFETF